MQLLCSKDSNDYRNIVGDFPLFVKRKQYNELPRRSTAGYQNRNRSFCHYIFHLLLSLLQYFDINVSDLKKLYRINIMTINKSNIILIGMPGAGKSMVGVILAKLTSRGFVDTDLLIQIAQNRSLQEIVDKDGHMTLRRIEEDVILGIKHRNLVIATGGSAVYSHVAMTHLKADGIAVFLKVDLLTLKSRVRNFDTRGLAKRPGQSLEDLFEERFPLYERYADIKIDCSHLTQEEVCAVIIKEEKVSRLT